MLVFKPVEEAEQWIAMLTFGYPESHTSNWEDIGHFSVGWLTPKGLVNDLSAALRWCNDHDMDPNLVLKPVVIAKGSINYEVIL